MFFGRLCTLRTSFEGVEILLKLHNIFAKAMKTILLLVISYVKSLPLAHSERAFFSCFLPSVEAFHFWPEWTKHMLRPSLV